MKIFNRTMHPSNAATVEPQNSAVLECRFCGAECLPELEELPCQNCGTDEIYRFLPVGTPRNYAEIKKHLGFTDVQIGNIFDLPPKGIKTSSAAPRYKKAAERFYYLYVVFGHG